ncbi:hypothetical protein [Brevibacillus laterosporus]|uniref:hypothetical protein n=1 Tax=Brevibacillus laterosporus TaxID=1465 RepID=UPI002E24F008|nr:hypothetical protein [Brevibacillus laterosporus]MED1670441.1 hypothetical protein [Brevibacillus laterosporus]MED1720681.1 hypothetical protein [Brevibacillus laterosporus]
MKLEEWKIRLAEQAIDSLVIKNKLCNPEDWKNRIRNNPNSIIKDLPWLVFVLADRDNESSQLSISNKFPNYFS